MKKYFRGRYFKCQSEDKTVSIIPAIHRGSKTNIASIQIITNDGAYFVNYPNHEYYDDKKSLNIKIGKNNFNSKGISLDIEADKICAKGFVTFGDLAKLKYDIMGFFKYVPLMECRHSIYSMKHSVDGILQINGKEYNFKNGVGYIEGDEGCSFPKEYAWTQCHFDRGSLMLSVANIPILGFHFIGIIGVVILDRKEYRIATYLGARVEYIGDGTIIVKQREYTLTAKLILKNDYPLYAPIFGEMARFIRESPACLASYKFQKNNITLLEFESNQASFEYEFI